PTECEPGRADRSDRGVHVDLSRPLGLVGRADLSGKRSARRPHPESSGVRCRRDTLGRRAVPALAAQADVPAILPQPARLPLRSLAPGLARWPGNGLGARAVLSALLLGAPGRS